MAPDRVHGRQFFHGLEWGDGLGMIQAHYVQAHLPPCGPWFLTGQEVGGPWCMTKTGTRKRWPAWGNHLRLISWDTSLAREVLHGQGSTSTTAVRHACPGPMALSSRRAFSITQKAAFSRAWAERLWLLILPRTVEENLGGRPTASLTHQSLKPLSDSPGPRRQGEAC